MTYDTNYRAVTSDFPSYTKTEVLKSRNNYVKTAFDYKTFGIGDALTVFGDMAGDAAVRKHGRLVKKLPAAGFSDMGLLK